MPSGFSGQVACYSPFATALEALCIILHYHSPQPWKQAWPMSTKGRWALPATVDRSSSISWHLLRSGAGEGHGTGLLKKSGRRGEVHMRSVYCLSAKVPTQGCRLILHAACALVGRRYDESRVSPVGCQGAHPSVGFNGQLHRGDRHRHQV